MKNTRGGLSLLNRIFHTITDWLLIILGVGLVIVAWRAIDVDFVKYSVIGVGSVLVVIGVWSRHRRVQSEQAGR